MRLFHHRHIAIAPERDVLDARGVQLEVEAGKQRRDCEIQFCIGKTAMVKMPLAQRSDG